MQNSLELHRFQKRSITCAVIVFILFAVLLARLIYLQIIEHRFYETLSERNVINVMPVSPTRGILYDRNGVVLAKNRAVYSLVLTSARVKKVDETLNALRNVVDLTDDEIKTFKRIRNQYYPYQPIPLKKTLTEPEVDRFYSVQYRFPGISIQTNMIRDYPLSAPMSAVVGYVGRISTKEYAEVDPTNYTASDDIGKAGVEAEDEVLLHGKMGSEQAEMDANGKVVRILNIKPATPGDNLYLTIDSKLQLFAEKLMGDNTGAIVAIDPSTGQVLALVTKPNYDPNIFSGKMTQAQYHAIMDDPDHPLVNRATRGLYAPGSTIKPFISFYALDNHIIDTEDYIYDPGWFQLPRSQHIYHSWTWSLHHKGLGWVNASKAITTSCDTFFYQLAVVLGIKRLDEALTQFGFGEVTGINLPLEKKGVVPSPAWKEAHVGHAWYIGDTVITGIGQGYTLVTPLQLATALSTLANRGQRIQPTVLLKIQQPDGTLTSMQPIEESGVTAKDPKSWDTVIQAMENVVGSPLGTAFPYWGKKADYTVAAKTGTAQVVRAKKDEKDKYVTQAETPFKQRDNHWFIAFAPTDHPKIALAIIVEHNPIAVQIGRQIIDFYLNELKEQAAALANPAPATPASSTPNATQPNQNVSSDIKNALQDDLQQQLRLQKADNLDGANKPAKPDNNNQPSQLPEDTLQQQMETRVNEQMEMQSEAPPQPAANENSESEDTNSDDKSNDEDTTSDNERDHNDKNDTDTTMEKSSPDTQQGFQKLPSDPNKDASQPDSTQTPVTDTHANNSPE